MLPKNDHMAVGRIRLASCSGDSIDTISHRRQLVCTRSANQLHIEIIDIDRELCTGVCDGGRDAAFAANARLIRDVGEGGP